MEPHLLPPHFTLYTYNHVFKALPTEPQHTKYLYTEIQHFLWTKQVDGQTKQKRRLVARNSLMAGIAMGACPYLILEKLSEVFSKTYHRKYTKKRS
jgi:hypothetical protein